MTGLFSRTEKLFGKENMERLGRARVAVFGIGGVGGYAVEVLVRSGVGTLDLIDGDTVSLSNINRQLIATSKNIGVYKVYAARDRINEINPDARVNVYPVFFTPGNASMFDFSLYDYVIDAMDMVTAKLCLIEEAYKKNTPVVSAMGAGNKLDPTAFEVADIYDTSVCPLAKVMRRELKKRGIKKLKTVYSKEKPRKPFTDAKSGNACGLENQAESGDCGGLSNRAGSGDACGLPNRAESGDGSGLTNLAESGDGGGLTNLAESGDGGFRAVKRQTPGSNAFVPAAAGLILGGEVVKDLCDHSRFAPVSK